ncbi:restriction endonuclease [Leucobacter sp. cx-169]|uniref:restriction endonuclease n=1 Tax=Leucobacter sp. cx-169 TaxID=2770549 RepID=UPI00165E4452|nr:restriction endonuclease [Leucobacter sp. cx-169]MBC9927390.1 restriction endonuclease [Leucobacter sp. cx-169]
MPLPQRDAFIRAILKFSDKIDDSAPGWEIERQFGDALDSVMFHGEWSMRQSRNRQLVKKYNTFRRLKFNAEAVHAQMATSLREAGLLDSSSRIGVSSLTPWVFSFGKELAGEWLLRGGAKLPEISVIAILVTSEAFTLLVDPISTYGYDDEGLPSRYHEGPICSTAESRVSEIVHAEVAGRLDFKEPNWDGFDISSVIERAVQSMKIAVDAERAEAAEADKFAAELASADSSLKEWQKFHHRPLISPYGLNPDEAEQWVCDWMLHMGAKGSKVTQYVGDGGIDVQADRYLAQVKMYAGSVGIASIREFAGVTFLDEDERRALFFTTGTYPLSAPALADRANMALFHFDLKTGTVSGANALGELYAARGFITER